VAWARRIRSLPTPPLRAQADEASRVAEQTTHHNTASSSHHTLSRRLLFFRPQQQQQQNAQLGRNLLMGNLNLLSLSMPVRMFEPRSYLQKLADVWVYPGFLAAAADPACPPERRLQLVATWFVAGLQHVYQSWRKPFNPILGETWAARLGDGTAIFMEQVAHHPPVSAFEMVGPGGAYTFSGTSQPDVSYKGAYKGADVKTTAKGSRRLSFAADAGTGRGAISIVYPHYWMRGVIGSGLPRGEMVGTAVLTYEGTGLVCELRFGRSPHPEDRDDALLQRVDTVTGGVFCVRPDGGGEGALDTGSPVASSSGRGPSPERRGGGGGGMLGSSMRGGAKGIGSRASLATFASALSLSGTGGGGGGSGTGGDGSPHPPRDALATCKGNWLSHLAWDGARAWTLLVDAPAEWMPAAVVESADCGAAAPSVLPSDAGVREDLARLAAATPADGSFAFDPVAVASSQRAKEELEHAQRLDAKLRKEGRAAAGLPA
jgi:hypothetical protein